MVALPSGVTSIGHRAFFGCERLALTALPSGVTHIKTEAFSNCVSLALTALPEGVKHIYEEAFSNCVSLALTVPLPLSFFQRARAPMPRQPFCVRHTHGDGVTHIDPYAFLGCTTMYALALGP